MDIPPGSDSFRPKPVRVSQLPHYQQTNRGAGNFGRGAYHIGSGQLLWNTLKETFYEFASISKIHGMYYLQKQVTSGLMRLLWIVIIAAFFAFGVALIFLLWEKFIDSPTRMTIASEMKIMQVPFPGVTICHPQSVMDYKAQRFVESIKFPLGATKDTILKNLPSLGYFTEHQWIFPRPQDLTMIDKVLQLNNYTIEQAIDKLGMICEDFIVICYWAGKKFPCFDRHAFLGWVGSTSHYGACCSFNYHPNVKGDQVPYAINTYGIHGGLSVVGTGYPQASDGKSGALYSEGFMLMIHHPHDFAVEASPLTLLRLGKETFVNVLPTDSRCSEQVLALPQNQRSCLVGGDFQPPIANYRQPACMLECLRNEVHRKCGCHPFHLPRQREAGKDREIRNCTVYDSICFVQNYYMFKRLKCHCLPACSDVTYKTASIELDFAAKNFSINPFYKETNLTNFEFIFHIFMSNQVVAANRRIVVVSWISLLSNLGGAFSLCLGISVLSLCEILFCIIFRIRKSYHRLKQQHEQRVKLVAPIARLQRFDLNSKPRIEN
ncbi:sodium channel protein Nach-like [Anopheles albimanus]|uniref:Uncharacterized protein n=1 Tax=Anopheles albimanus TaxID=7167 RepID=A0A182FM32_ANOAL|nr:sodium channel protein Nach-like [Anopheles albimanus]